MNILVCGGAGYIGSHMVKALLDAGENVGVLDSLELGHRAAICSGARLFKADLRNYEQTESVFAKEHFDAVIHFAAFSQVAESMKNPGKYFENNVNGTANLLRAMAAHGSDKIVFSSTASVYGIPERLPITEDMPTNPINAYGDSKLAAERLIRYCEAAHGIKSVRLRYFNVAGAHEDGVIGEDHDPETHLIPNILKSLAGGAPFKLFGNDYATPDGTCIRDYIHIQDLIKAHSLALEHLSRGGESAVYNLGSQNGYSNLEIIRAAEDVTGRKLQYTVEARRPGDPDSLVASSEKIKNELGWAPRLSLEDMISSAWKWHRSNPEGYAE